MITASVFGHGGGYKPADRVKRALSVANGGGGYVPHHDVCAALLGIDWPMKKRELSESIPPAYTEWIGRQLVSVIPARADEAR